MYRSETDKVVGGVCGGLGEYLEVDPVLIRLIWIFLTFMGGSGIIVYIVFWLVLPTKSQVETDQTQIFESNAQDIVDTGKKAVKAVENVVKEKTQKKSTETNTSKPKTQKKTSKTKPKTSETKSTKTATKKKTKTTSTKKTETK